MLKRIVLLLTVVIMTKAAGSQEIQARLTVLASKISTGVDKKIFQTLQTTLTNFINNRKWTKDEFQVNERIQCNFLLNVEQELGNNMYKGSLTVQAARPVFNSSYDSPLINFIDDNVVFRYQEFQPVEFNENRVQGNDPSAANLPAVIAYYVHPVNIQTACLIMEGAEFTENIINGVERPVKAAELFAFTLRVRAGNTDVLTDAEENVRQKLRAEGVM